MSEVICHMLKRIDKVKAGNQLAIGQEYKEWLITYLIKELVPQNILFINTSTFGQESQ